MKKTIMFSMLCMTLMLMSCDKSDDITNIFVSKTWKLNYIASGSIGKTWYKFSDVTEDNYQEYADRTKVFTIAFSGSQTGDVIKGTFIGNGSLSVTGDWSANGDNRSFTTNNVNGSVTDNKDVIAQKILSGLANATSYKGDINNLFIYFKYQNETLFMAFTKN
jgi:hypothetical protein